MRKLGVGVLIVALFLIVAPLPAQMGMGSMPTMNGIWSPVVGAGSVYEMVNEKDGKKSTMEISVVSKDTVDGKEGHWLEMQMTDSNGQLIIMQEFMVKDGAQVNVTKFIFQVPGRGPMMMSAQNMGMMGGRRGGMTPPPTNSAADVRSSGKVVGNESITTPAGTFDCSHWQSADGTENAWISPKIAPWALVKANGKGNSMVLIKVVTDAKSHITGTPMNMDDMMRGRGPGL
jgi:hypothetical protein